MAFCSQRTCATPGQSARVFLCARCKQLFWCWSWWKGKACMSSQRLINLFSPTCPPYLHSCAAGWRVLAMCGSPCSVVFTAGSREMHLKIHPRTISFSDAYSPFVVKNYPTHIKVQVCTTWCNYCAWICQHRSHWLLLSHKYVYMSCLFVLNPLYGIHWSGACSPSTIKMTLQTYLSILPLK